MHCQKAFFLKNGIRESSAITENMRLRMLPRSATVEKMADIFTKRICWQPYPSVSRSFKNKTEQELLTDMNRCLLFVIHLMLDRFRKTVDPICTFVNFRCNLLRPFTFWKEWND